MSAASADRRSSRPGKLIVTLRVPSTALAKYVSKPPAKKIKLKAPESNATVESPAPASSEPGTAPTAPFTPNASELPPILMEQRRKGIPGPKPGTKRGPVLGPDGLPRPRGKPGPKKKPRLEDGTIDHNALAARAPGGPLAHKLGPKANQGAINAGLRALDRSGAPCRRWSKTGLQIKSFTGVVWGLPTWRTPKPTSSGDGESPNGGTTVSSDSAGKENQASSAVSSEKSNSGLDVSADAEVNDSIMTAPVETSV